MENLLYPVCLDEYCNYFGIAFYDLSLPCIFCRRTLSTLELISFNAKRLSLVWRNEKCYAACIACIKKTADIEKNRYFQCVVPGEFIEHVSQTRLQELNVRCIECMALLTPSEKIDIIACGGDFFLVRGHWKGYCCNCGSNAWENSNFE